MKLIKLFLLFGLILSSFQLMAQSASCIGKDAEIAPPISERTTTNANNNVVDTQKWIDWKNGKPDWNIRKDYTCCEKLVLNTTTRVCEDKSIADPDLKSCSGANAHSECEGNLGCLAFDEDSMFKVTDDMSEAERNEKLQKQAEYEKAIEEIEEQKPIGGFCFRNVECESYSCKDFRCQPNFSCRMATVGDPATPAKVKCEEPYVKDNLDKCIDPNVPYFKGPLGEIVVTPVPGAQNQCQFELTPTDPGAKKADVEGAIKLAIISTRAMEWLFATTSQDRDCTYSMDLFRDKMKALIERRKVIIKDYNINFKKLESTFSQINTSAKDNMGTVATLCDGEVTTQHDIAMRKASGLDVLCYMKQRNLAFMLYEAEMFKWATDVNALVEKYRSNVAGWGEKDKNWTIGDTGRDWKGSRTCRYWINLWVGVITPKKMKRRWEERYWVNPGSGATVFDSDTMKDYFAMVGDSNTANRIKAGWYYLLDPLLPGDKGQGMAFRDWGSSAGSIEGAGHDRVISTKTLHDMHAKYQNRIIDFMKKLKLEGDDADFIAEPDSSGSFKQRGCLTKIDAPECKEFKDYIKKLSDVSLAQMISFSQHRKPKYKSYYKSEGSFRNKYLLRLQTDTDNLNNYYVAMADLRNKQNACIDRVISQLRGSEFNGQGQGLAEGASNYYNPTLADYTGANTNEKGYNKPKISKNLGLKPFQFSISSQKGLKDSVNKDDMGQVNVSDLATMDAGNRASLAARNKKVAETNAAAAAKGLDVKKEEAEFKQALRNSSSFGGGKSSVASSAAGLSSGAGSGAAKVTIGDEAAKTDDMSGTGKLQAGAAGGMAAGANAGALSGIVGGSASGATAGAGESIPQQDPTGMSDEEKDMMSRNIDRNRSQYNPKEDDSLFQVVSKTYVRNLDKILTRKKKLDEDSASYPSTPSTP